VAVAKIDLGQKPYHHVQVKLVQTFEMLYMYLWNFKLQMPGDLSLNGVFGTNGALVVQVVVEKEQNSGTGFARPLTNPASNCFARSVVCTVETA